MYITPPGEPTAGFYYVDSTIGNDAADGLWPVFSGGHGPWKTARRGIDPHGKDSLTNYGVRHPGDVVTFSDGTYYCQEWDYGSGNSYSVTAREGGTQAAPIVIQAATRGGVTFDFSRCIYGDASGLWFQDAAQWWIIDGFVFYGAPKYLIALYASHVVMRYCTIPGQPITHVQDDIKVLAQYVTIEYCEFDGGDLGCWGQFIDSIAAHYLTIRYNTFHRHWLSGWRPTPYDTGGGAQGASVYLKGAVHGCSVHHNIWTECGNRNDPLDPEYSGVTLSYDGCMCVNVGGYSTGAGHKGVAIYNSPVDDNIPECWDSSVYDNIIDNCYYGAASFWEAWDCQYVNNTATRLHGWWGIAAWGNLNKFDGTLGSAVNNGYWRHNSKRCTAENNVFEVTAENLHYAQTGDNGELIRVADGNGEGWQERNNVWYWPAGVGKACVSWLCQHSNRHHITVAAYSVASGQGHANQFSDPLLDGDWSPYSASRVGGAGVQDSYVPLVDYNGRYRPTPPCIGACEPWRAPYQLQIPETDMTIEALAPAVYKSSEPTRKARIFSSFIR